MTTPVNLLLIEDSAPDAKLLELRLRESLPGASIEREQTLSAGLARLGDGGIDAVLLDLGLPDSAGLDTFRSVSGAGGGAAVVVLTGLSDASLAKEAVALGAQDYLVKDDATPDALARAITYAITRQHSLAALEETRRAQMVEKDRFLSHVSHELRTPLAAVHQFVSLVADGTTGPLNADQQDCLDVAMRNIRQVTVMIDDLLAIARLKEGKLPVVPEVVDLPALILECVAAFQLVAKERGVSLRTWLQALPPVSCDPRRTREVVGNLVDNALKFTPPAGTVTLAASVDGDHVRVTVEDTGRGLRTDNRDRIFEQFFQEDGGDAAGRTGLGIGLYLCRQFVEGQGGTIQAGTTSGGGALFTFTVPLATAHQQGAAR